jgi:hypothetical protein
MKKKRLKNHAHAKINRAKKKWIMNLIVNLHLILANSVRDILKRRSISLSVHAPNNKERSMKK